MTAKSTKPVVWVGSTRKDLRALPQLVRDVFGFALYVAQTGGKHAAAKPLKASRAQAYLKLSRILTETRFEPFTQ
jgi:phage-related protein